MYGLVVPFTYQKNLKNHTSVKPEFFFLWNKFFHTKKKKIVIEADTCFFCYECHYVCGLRLEKLRNNDDIITNVDNFQLWLQGFLFEVDYDVVLNDKCG